MREDLRRLGEVDVDAWTEGSIGIPADHASHFCLTDVFCKPLMACDIRKNERAGVHPRGWNRREATLDIEGGKEHSDNNFREFRPIDCVFRLECSIVVSAHDPLVDEVFDGIIVCVREGDIGESSYDGESSLCAAWWAIRKTERGTDGDDHKNQSPRMPGEHHGNHCTESCAIHAAAAGGPAFPAG